MTSKSKKIWLGIACVVFLVQFVIVMVLLLAPAKSPGFSLVDLSRHTNGVLHTSWLPNEDPGNNLATLPTGRQEFGGVAFDVQGLIQLQGQCWVKRRYMLPEKVAGMPVRRSCQRVHILHANSGFGDPLGTKVASLVLHYADGGQTELEIQHLVHVLDFWDYKGHMPADANTVIAWTGDSPATARRGLGVRLCRSTFENPHPRKRIETIDYVSAMAGSAPFLVALTVE